MTEISLRWVWQVLWNRKVSCICWAHSPLKRGTLPSPRARHARAGGNPAFRRYFWHLSLRGNDGYFDRLVLKKAGVVHENLRGNIRIGGQRTEDSRQAGALRPHYLLSSVFGLLSSEKRKGKANATGSRVPGEPG
jgi:hypothetical protein